MELAEAFLKDHEPSAAFAALDTSSEDAALEAYGEIVGLVAAINGALQLEPDAGHLGASATLLDDLGISNGILERLQKWLKELRAKLGEIAAVLRAATYSISVGGPVPSVSVTIEFDR